MRCLVTTDVLAFLAAAVLGFFAGLGLAVSRSLTEAIVPHSAICISQISKDDNLSPGGSLRCASIPKLTVCPVRSRTWPCHLWLALFTDLRWITWAPRVPGGATAGGFCSARHREQQLKGRGFPDAEC